MSEYWMGLSELEYKILSFILFNIGPEGSYTGSIRDIAEALGVEEARVREALERLEARRILRVSWPREGEAEGSVARAFNIFSEARGENELLSYLRREVRGVYLALLKAFRELVDTIEGGRTPSKIQLESVRYYNGRLEGYRSLGQLIAARLEEETSGRPGFETVLKALYEVALYLYPTVALLPRRVRAPWGEELRIYTPSSKALSSRIHSISNLVQEAEAITGKPLPREVRVLILEVLVSLRRDLELYERFQGLLRRLEAMLHE